MPDSISNSVPKLLFSLLLVLIDLLGMSTAQAQDDAKLLMQLVPDHVKAGERFTVMLQFRNSGTTTWSRAAGYRLASRNADKWGLKSVKLESGEKIAPGQSATFKFEVTAPIDDGAHDFVWQMKKGNQWFGQPSNKVSINVAAYLRAPDDAEFVYQKVATEMVTDLPYTALLHFKNTGETSWTPGRYQLKAVDPDEGLNWSVTEIDLNKIVRPGEFYTFRFNIIAPSGAGRYPFQWQLTHKGVGVFGARSEKLFITVNPE